MVFFLSFLILVVVVTAMSIGVIFANKPIKGSCGGMSALGIDTACDICGGDKNKCEKENMKEEESSAQHKQALAYDAVKK